MTNKITNIKVLKLDPDAKLPERGSEGAEGFDLYATGVEPGEDMLSGFIKTGIAIELPEGYYAELHLRSSTSKKLNLLNNVGIIDNDYRGEIKLLVSVRQPFTPLTRVVEAGERVGQLLIKKSTAPEISFEFASELSETVRGEGGFGSTGTQDIQVDE